MLEMARRDKKPTVQALERALIDAKRLIFLFSESKEFTYKSMFGKAYKAVYYIDKVEVYVDETPFTAVRY
jgi:hypothetical protein